MKYYSKLFVSLVGFDRFLVFSGTMAVFRSGHSSLSRQTIRACVLEDKCQDNQEETGFHTSAHTRDATA